MDTSGNTAERGGDTAEGGGDTAESGGAATKPRNPLDKLSKDELLTKCRNLIAIAQKAKSAKDGEGCYD